MQTYATLTDQDKDNIRREFAAARQLGCDTQQAVAIAARSGLHLTDRRWNGPAGSNAYAAALATLVMDGKIVVRTRK